MQAALSIFLGNQWSKVSKRKALGAGGDWAALLPEWPAGDHRTLTWPGQLPPTISQKSRTVENQMEKQHEHDMWKPFCCRGYA